MSTVAIIAVLLVAALHAYFMVLEMVLWTKPFGRKTFGLTPEFAEESKGLAANQGLYNGFLVAGLLWSVICRIDHPAGLRGRIFLSGVRGRRRRVRRDHRQSQGSLGPGAARRDRPDPGVARALNFFTARATYRSSANTIGSGQ